MTAIIMDLFMQITCAGTLYFANKDALKVKTRLSSHVAANIMDLFMQITCAGTLYFANKDALKVKTGF